MSKREKLLWAIRNNPGNVRFDDVCRAAELIGFRLRGQSGSHRTYAREGEPVLLNFQNVKGKAKPYQVRQLGPAHIKSKHSAAARNEARQGARREVW